MPKRRANARWEGSLTEGNGTMRMASGAYEGPYSFQSRFQEGEGTNPEELIAAAHAGCFTMALSAQLAEAGHAPNSVKTTARVQIRNVDGLPTIDEIKLETEGEVPGIDQATFEENAEGARSGCAVSRALAGVSKIEVSAKLTG
jgi:lipoyl-dependent peroxiredoxin